MKSTATTQRHYKQHLSARRRVGGHSWDKTSKSDPANSPARNRHKQVLLWPESVPKEERLPLLAGERSFATTYRVSPQRMKRGQEVRIQGHALACCEDSRLLIERDHEQFLIERGQKVLLSDTTVILSELPPYGIAPGTFYYWFFGDKVLADIVSMHPRTSSYFFIAAGYPCADGIIPVRHATPDVFHNPALRKQDRLVPALTFALNLPTLAFWKLCLHRVTIPRLRIQIFLENLVLHSLEEHDAILTKYPGGNTALLREMGHLKMPSISTMVDQRRFELCFAWQTYGGKTLEEITKALKVPQPRRFLARYERWVAKTKPFKFSDLRSDSYGDTLLAANSFLPSLRGQYWSRREQQEQEELDGNRYAPLIHHEGSVTPIEQPIRIPPSPVPNEVVSLFWEMKNTGVEILIAAEQFTLVPGLENCTELLKAA